MCISIYLSIYLSLYISIYIYIYTYVYTSVKNARSFRRSGGLGRARNEAFKQQKHVSEQAYQRANASKLRNCALL